MRTLAAVGAVSMVVLGSAGQAVGHPGLPSRFIAAVRHTHHASPSLKRTARLLVKQDAKARAARPTGAKARLSTLELDIVARINQERTSRGLRALRVSRGLTAAADYHSRQMGLFGFFEHESHNGAPFWRRIERFYPAGRGYYSVGENIFWESPDTSGASAVHEWMVSPPHRQNILTREWRDLGVAAVHFAAAPGAFGGRPVTIVTADFGVRH